MIVYSWMVGIEAAQAMQGLCGRAAEWHLGLEMLTRESVMVAAPVDDVTGMAAERRPVTGPVTRPVPGLVLAYGVARDQSQKASCVHQMSATHVPIHSHVKERMVTLTRRRVATRRGDYEEARPKSQVQSAARAGPCAN